MNADEVSRIVSFALWLNHRFELERMAFEKKLSFTNTKAEVDFEIAEYLRDSVFTRVIEASLHKQNTP